MWQAALLWQDVVGHAQGVSEAEEETSQTMAFNGILDAMGRLRAVDTGSRYIKQTGPILLGRVKHLQLNDYLSPTLSPATQIHIVSCFGVVICARLDGWLNDSGT